MKFSLVFVALLVVFASTASAQGKPSTTRRTSTWFHQFVMLAEIVLYEISDALLQEEYFLVYNEAPLIRAVPFLVKPFGWTNVRINESWVF